MDYEAPSNVLDVIDLVYEIVSRDDALPRVLARLASFFGCPSGALVYVEVGRRAADVQLGYGLFDAAVQARYAAEYAAIDPAPAAMARFGLGEAVATDRVFSPEERETSRFLTEFYYPLGLREALAARIATERGRHGLIAVHRGPERPPFNDEEIAAFAAIARHLSRAVDLRRRFFEMEGALARYERALDDDKTAVLWLDSAGALEQANAAARALIARGDVLLAHRSGQVGAADAEVARRLKAMFAQRSGQRRAELMTCRDRLGHTRVLRAAPLPASQGGGWRLMVAELAARVRDGGEAARALEQALDLTPSGADLTLALLRGDDLASYAKVRGLSPHTARFHLKAAFKASGAHRQSELVRVASDLLRDLGL